MALNYRIIFLFVLMCLVACAGARGQTGEPLFKKYCGSCHSIGGGKLVGPDLGGIASRQKKEWIRKFVINSAEMIKSGDPDAISVAKTFNNMIMPPFAGTEPELTSIISYLESSAGSLAQGSVKDTFLLAAKEENFSRGKELFTGRIRFMNGGPSCITCHSVNNIGGIGGSYAKSLNLSWFTLQGQGIKSMMQAPAFPAMINAYGTKTLTESEIYDVAAFLKFNSRKVLTQQIPDARSSFYLIGIAGCIGGIFLLYFLWRIRKRNSVNKSIFDRQIHAEI